DINALTAVNDNASMPPNPAFEITADVPAHLMPNATLEVKVTYAPKRPTNLAGAANDPTAHDFVSLNAEFGGSLDATLTIPVKGARVSIEASGGAGCSVGPPRGAWPVMGLVLLLLLGRGRYRRRCNHAGLAAASSLAAAASLAALAWLRRCRHQRLADLALA